MKKTVLLLLLCFLSLLSGCGSLYSQRREVEQLRLMEALGLDTAPEGLRLSLSAAGEDEEPRSYSGEGTSLSQALEQLRRRSGEELFCGHLQTLLVGEDYARRGMESLLSAVCRSSDLRLDQPVLLVLGGSAREALEETPQVSAALRALFPGQEQSAALSTAGSLLRDLDRQGSSLIRALRLEASSREEATGRSLVPAGYGILAGDRLLTLLDPEEGMAAELLTETLTPCPLVLRDREGRAVTLELQRAETGLRPLWNDDGALSGLELRLQVHAALWESEGFPPFSEDGYLEDLTGRLEAELLRRVGNLLRLSRELEADFLGLGRRLELASPLRCRGLSKGLGPLLPSLSFRLRLQGELLHSNDIR